MGEETDGVVESVSKLQSKVKALSGVNILTDTGAYKDTYTIIKEIAQVWDQMNDIDRAALLELLAGKNRSNAMAAMLTNIEDLEGAYQYALDAEGSAMAENEKQLDSIQGRITLFKNATQTMWTNTLNSDVIKFLVDVGTWFVKLTDKVGLLNTALGVLATWKFGKYFVKQNLELTKQGYSASDIWKKEKESSFGVKNLFKKTSKENTKDSAEVVAAKQAAEADNAKTVSAKNAAAADDAKVVATKNFINSMTADNAPDASKDSEVDAAQKVAEAKEREVQAAEKTAQADEAKAQAALEAAKSDTTEAAGSEIAEKADIKEAAGSKVAEHADIKEAVVSETAEKADIKEAAASEQAKQADLDEAAASRQAGQADSSEASTSIGSSVASSGALGSVIGGLKGLAIGALIGVVVGLINKGIGAIIDFIHREEKIKEEVVDLTKEYKSAEEEFNRNIKSLTESSDVSMYESLYDEFTKLARGVDVYGNNIGLTTDQYERYKSICETIVGVNDELMRGYNSSTEAIGNNVNILSTLIELEKERARANAEEYVNPENLSKIADNAYNNYWDAASDKNNENLPSYPSVAPSFDTSFSKWWKMITAEDKMPNNKFDLEEWKERQLQKFREEFDTWYQEFLNKNGLNADTKPKDLNNEQYKIFENKLRDWSAIASKFSSSVDSNVIDKLDAEELNGMREAMAVYLSSIKGYADSSDSIKKFMSGFVGRSSDFMVTSSFDPDKDPEKWGKKIKEVYKAIAESANNPETWQSLSFEGDSKFNAEQLLDKIYNLDPSSVSWDKYQDEMQELVGAFWKSVGVSDPTAEQKNFFGAIDIDFATKNKDINKWVDVLSSRLEEGSDEIQKKINQMPANEVEAFLKVDWNVEAPNSWDDVTNAIKEQLPSIDKIVGNTFSNYSTTFEDFTNAQSIQNEVIYDNIKLTEEQGDALKELIGDEEDYADAIDSTNGYVVKNVNVLNKLIAKKKQEAVQNARTEKTQARLKYYELYKKIRKLTGASGEFAQANVKEINALYKEMGAVERTITKYSLLEQKLLGAADAYQKYEDAKAADEAKDYGSKAEEMVSGVIEGLQSGKLGTESFMAAVLGTIPEDVYSGLDTVEEKVAAIANYLKNSDFSKYFTLKFGDDGTLESAEMTLDNVQAFIESAQEKGVFTNKGDWQHFELSSDIKTLDDFCKAMNITKEIAFATFAEIDSYDAEWLNGDFGSIFDQLDLGLEGNIFMAQKRISELDVAFANGKISAEQYTAAMYGTGEAATEEQKAMGGLQGQLDKNTKTARESAQQWSEASKNYEDAKKNVEELSKQIKNADKDANISNLEEQLANAMSDMQNYGELMEKYQVSDLVIQVAIDDVQKDIDEVEKTYEDLAKNVEFNNETGKYNIKSEPVWNGDTPDQVTIDNYLKLLDERHTLEVMQGESLPTTLDVVQEISDTLTTIAEILAKHYGINIDTGEADDSVSGLLEKLGQLKPKDIVVNIIGQVSDTLKTWWARITGDAEFSGTISTNSWDGAPPKSTSRGRQNLQYVNGTAHAQGNWGLPQAEDDALVGELGMETVVDPKTGKYYTVGDNGAEFVDLPKNAIIFNHKQTEELFKNGHINSRGKAYSEGNAHVTIVPDYTTPTYYSGANNYNFWTDWSDAADSLSDAGDDLSDAANDFEEMFDWFAVLLEEIDDDLNYMSAALENAVGISAKNDIQEQMINVNKFKLTELGEGYKLYADYAAELLGKVPEQYRDLAEKGGVALTHFLGEANQEVVEAINNYREWAQKASDVRTQQQQVKKEITSISLEKVQTIADEYDRVITKITTLNDLLQANVDLIEEQGERTSAVMYEEMIKNSSKELDELQKKRDAMQKEFDAQVSAGNIDVGSEEWYEGISAIQDVDKSIIDCRKDIEGFQNSINQLHWDNFDGLIEAIDNVGNEISNLGDLIDDEDIADEMGNWTDKGITKMGLLAQEMERAQYRAKQYAEQIEYLNQEYAAGKYSTDEYNEKLQELRDGQWDSIKSYEAAKDALVDLNKTRVDAAKNAMQKEIDAYNELINKKKEELQLSKDAHDFSKQVAEQQKNIASIQKQLAAIAGDNSASAIARRKKLEAELASAQEELDELYYNHSIEKQQDALDDQAERYQNEKEKEMEALDEYLKNVEQVIADSFATITGNTEAVAETLKGIADEYGINLSEAITNPWEQGVIAIGTYQDQLDTSMSAFTAQLDAIKKQLLDLQAEADNTARHLIEATNQNASKTSSATYTAPTPSTPSQPSTPQTPSKPAAPANGSSVTVKKSATNFSRDGGNGTRMQSWVPGSTFTVYQVSGSEVLIGRNGQYTGWVRLSDLEGYAKGIKKVPNNQLAITDELGLEELVLHAGDNGRLQYLSKGSSVIPADITDNLMKLGSLDPKDILDRNRPKIGVPYIVNNSIELNMSFGNMINIEHADKDSIPEIKDVVKAQLDSYMKNINSSLKKYTR